MYIYIYVYIYICIYIYIIYIYIFIYIYIYTYLYLWYPKIPPRFHRSSPACATSATSSWSWTQAPRGWQSFGASMGGCNRWRPARWGRNGWKTAGLWIGREDLHRKLETIEIVREIVGVFLLNFKAIQVLVGFGRWYEIYEYDWICTQWIWCTWCTCIHEYAYGYCFYWLLLYTVYEICDGAQTTQYCCPMTTCASKI